MLGHTGTWWSPRRYALLPHCVMAFSALTLASQYRSALNVNAESMSAAANSLRRIDKLVRTLSESLEAQQQSLPVGDDRDGEVLRDCVSGFEAAMCRDMNTPKAMASVFRLVAHWERRMSDGGAAAAGRDSVSAALGALRAMDGVLGILYEPPPIAPASSDNDIVANSASANLVSARSLAEQRVTLKREKKFAEADLVRSQITDLGFAVVDTKGGGFELVEK